MNPFSKNDKIAGQADEEEFYDEVVPLGGVSHSQEIIRQSNDNSVRSNVNLSRSNENLNFASKTDLRMTKQNSGSVKEIVVKSNDISEHDLQRNIRKLNDRASASKYIDPRWEKYPNHPDNQPRDSRGFRSTNTFTVQRESNAEENNEQPEPENEDVNQDQK